MKRTVTPPPAPSRQYLGWVVAVGLVLAACLVYANALHNPFIWDDPYLVTENHLITHWKYLPDIFTHHLYYSTAGVSNFYRPLQLVVLMIDYAFWKTNVVGYHLTSILFHVVCGWLAYLVITRLFHRRGVAALVALLFIVHPVNSTVVDYIASRADAQAACFMLLSFWLFFSAGRWIFAGSLLAFVLALLSKEMAVVLPLWLLASLAVLGRKSYRKILPHVVIFGIYLVLRSTVLHFPTTTTTPPPHLAIRLLTTCEAFVRLIGQLIVPHAIHIEKGIPFTSGFFETRTLLSLLALTGIGAFMWWVRRRSLMCCVGLTWFFVTLLPMANIVPINTTFADHWLYLPGIGVFLAVIGGAADWLKNLSPRRRAIMTRIGLAGYAVAVGIFGVLTVKQNTIWADPERFFRLALQYSPQSFRAHNELGVIYIDRRQYAQAVTELQQAIHANPAFDQAYDNLGIAYDHLDQLDASIAVHLKAIALNPHNPKTYNNLGNAYLRAGQLPQAIETFQKALQLNPSYKAAYNNLGAVYYHLGEFAKARAYWEQALRIDPHFTMAAENLQVLLKETQHR